MRKRTLPLIALVLLAVGITALYVSRGSPSLVRWQPRAAVLYPPQLLILNPLRERRPERTCTQLLERLKRQGPSALISLLCTSENASDIAELERTYPVVSWRLADYETPDSGRIRIEYGIKRAGGYASGRPVESRFSFFFTRSEHTWILSCCSPVY